MDRSKRCGRCEKIKPADEFYRRGKSLGCWCKPCCADYAAGHKAAAHTKGTLPNFKLSRWTNLNQRTVNGLYARERKNSSYFRKGIRLELTKEEFYAWCDQHAEEILNITASGGVPSVDRKDPEGHYNLDNMRVLPSLTNELAGLKEAHKKIRRPVVGTSLDGQTTVAFECAAETAVHGFSKSAVTHCANGRTKQHKGFIWSYESQENG